MIDADPNLTLPTPAELARAAALTAAVFAPQDALPDDYGPADDDCQVQPDDGLRDATRLPWDDDMAAQVAREGDHYAPRPVIY